MFKILTLNHISVTGLERLPRERYEIASEFNAPDAILLRSHKLTDSEVSPSVLAIARAGAGVNNIPVEHCSERGIVVFNTPGANANAVKELVLTGMLLGCRGVLPGIAYANSLDGLDAVSMHQQLEAEKKRFKGHELAGKTLGIVGLGAIGSMIAQTALALGMRVVGYDPALSVEAAWRLPNQVERAEGLGSLSKCDFLTLHVPALDSTLGLIGREFLSNCKPGMKLLNFSRAEIVDNGAVLQALDAGRLGRYICDFPAPELLGRDDVVLMPHIGASTQEAEDNCAIMAAEQLRDFLEHGNIRNSVNFPSLVLERSPGYRLTVTNRNVPKMLGQLLNLLADANINVLDMLNKSRGDLAYNLIDLEQCPEPSLLDQMRAIEGVIGVRLIEA